MTNFFGYFLDNSYAIYTPNNAKWLQSAQVYIRDLKIHYGDVDENATTQ